MSSSNSEQKTQATTDQTDNRVGIDGAGGNITATTGSVISIQDVTPALAAAAIDANKAVSLDAIDKTTATATDIFDAGNQTLQQIAAANATMTTAEQQANNALALQLVDKTTQAVIDNSQGATADLITKALQYGAALVAGLAVAAVVYGINKKR